MIAVQKTDHVRDKAELVQIEDRLRARKSMLEGINPVWQTVNEKKKSLEGEIEQLEERRSKILQGQTSFNFGELNF